MSMLIKKVLLGCGRGIPMSHATKNFVPFLILSVLFNLTYEDMHKVSNEHPYWKGLRG
jgi:hypothetical protein